MKDWRVYLAHILECVEAIESYTQGMSEEDFLAAPHIQDAVIRRIEVMGEAAARMPAEVREQYPHIPWGQMIGMRNMLIHEYFNVDTYLVWDTVRQDIPKLKAQLKSIPEK